MHDNGGRPLAAVFAPPGEYIRSAGALGRIGEAVGRAGSARPLILGDPVVDGIMGNTSDDIAGAPRRVRRRVLPRREMDRVAQAALEYAADATVGIGGGKTIDAARAVAHPAGFRPVIVSTIASTSTMGCDGARRYPAPSPAGRRSGISGGGAVGRIFGGQSNPRSTAHQQMKAGMRCDILTHRSRPT